MYHGRGACDKTLRLAIKTKRKETFYTITHMDSNLQALAKAAEISSMYQAWVKQRDRIPMLT